jgi:hypothetical protein
MRRVYYHHEDREECAPGGMWRIVAGTDERSRFVVAAGVLMAFPARFRDSMLRAVREWPRSCEMNMTTPSLNQRAWFGHAGCFLATGSPEDCTRLGWHTLTPDQQGIANRMADEAIAAWRYAYQPLAPVLFDA